MTFTREVEVETDARSITLTPKAPHPWLQGIIITCDADYQRAEVYIALNESAPMDQLDRKMEQLEGLKVLFEPAHMMGENSESEEYYAIVLDAGPHSKIRSILQQADLPVDIREAVLQDLQEIWAKAVNK